MVQIYYIDYHKVNMYVQEYQDSFFLQRSPTMVVLCITDLHDVGPHVYSIHFKHVKMYVSQTSILVSRVYLSKVVWIGQSVRIFFLG